ncbi:hypothetical protein B0T19DRAFT_432827 [Cercophora scortea]|uniref:Uncharacterized protein n=1 Tax=Cercophora scortea TaxID=314031 RepID=A0AAE0I8I0_9PEZI|nr:hypothetical protein B0T19DRAFT_432827 [Cercophora scortea]
MEGSDGDETRDTEELGPPAKRPKLRHQEPEEQPANGSAGLESHPPNELNSKHSSRSPAPSPSPSPSTSSSPAPSRSASPMPAWAIPAQPNSFIDILRRTTRTPIFVHPLHWTPTHLRLLNCQFYDDSDSDTEDDADNQSEKESASDFEALPVQRPFTRAQQTAHRQIRHVSRLEPGIDRRHAAHHVGRIMRSFGLRGRDITKDGQQSRSLDFQFGVIGTFPLPVIGTYYKSAPDNQYRFPVLAYMDRGEVDRFLKEHYMLSTKPGRKMSRQVDAVRALRLKKLLKLRGTRDPMIVAMLIALAEAQVLKWTTNHGEGKNRHAVLRFCLGVETDAAVLEEMRADLPEPPTVWPGYVLLSTGVPERNSMHLFTADIPSAYIALFYNLWRYTDPPPLVVRVGELPLRPEKEFLQKLREGLRIEPE